MKRIQSLEEFDQEIKNEEIPTFNTNLVYNKINDKRNIFKFKFKKVVLVTCISVLTCTSLVFAATKLNNALYNNKGEKIFEVSSLDKFRKENPTSVDSNQLRKDLISKYPSESYLADSELKDGEMVVKLYKGNGEFLLDYTSKSQAKDNVSYNYDSKFASFYSFDEFKKALGDWAKLPKYLPADSQFSNARIRYALDPELISQLRNEMIVDLKTKPDGFTYRIIKIPTKSMIRNIQIAFSSTEYGYFSMNLFHGSYSVLAADDSLISKLTLKNNKEAIIDKNTGSVFYADESQMKESSELSQITSLDNPSSGESQISKNPLKYTIEKLSLKSLDEVKKILESIE